MSGEDRGSQSSAFATKALIVGAAAIFLFAGTIGIARGLSDGVIMMFAMGALLLVVAALVERIGGGQAGPLKFWCFPPEAGSVRFNEEMATFLRDQMDQLRNVGSDGEADPEMIDLVASERLEMRKSEPPDPVVENDPPDQASEQQAGI